MIAWLFQSQRDLIAPPTAWLSAAEQAEYAGLRSEKRRQDWLTGRWTAKRLIQAARPDAGGVPLGAIQLDRARGRAPQAWWPGSERPWPLSISHCDGRAVAALDDEPGAPLGIDLERVEAREPGFVEDYFTPAEQADLGGGPEMRAERVTAIWCAKEAALKALGVGLTWDTRAVNVRLAGADGPGWLRLTVEISSAVWGGWWRRHGPYGLAIVSGSATARAAAWPVEMEPVVSRPRAA